MTLTFRRKNHTLRSLNKNIFTPGDPAGDAFYSYTITALSGEAVVATVDVELSAQERYCPEGAIKYVRIRSVWVKKKDIYHPGLMDQARREEILFEDAAAVEAMITREWEAWCVKAGLVGCLE